VPFLSIFLISIHDVAIKAVMMITAQSVKVNPVTLSPAAMPGAGIIVQLTLKMLNDR